jgi:hypothetical protein
MLNLRIAMRRLILVVSLVSMLMLPTLVADAQDATITPATQIIILAPAPGQALQGTILINGEINVGQPLTIELSFSYSDNARETWFIIQEIEQANPGEFNLEWDTTTLTDGQYTLRLVVTTEQDQFIAYAPSLRVRNYSAIETSTPVPTSTPAPVDTHAPAATPTMTITPVPPTATPLPPNPAQINTGDISRSIGKGALAALSLFAILGIYQYVRNRSRRRD